MVVIDELHDRLTPLAWRRMEGLIAAVLKQWGRVILVGEMDFETLKKLLPIAQTAESVWLTLEEGETQ
jgi:hypothetical protein